MGLETRATTAPNARIALIVVIKTMLIILTCVFVVPAVFTYAAAHIWIRSRLGLPTNPTEARVANERQLKNLEARPSRLTAAEQLAMARNILRFSRIK